MGGLNDSRQFSDSLETTVCSREDAGKQTSQAWAHKPRVQTTQDERSQHKKLTRAICSRRAHRHTAGVKCACAAGPLRAYARKTLHVTHRGLTTCVLEESGFSEADD